AGGGCGHAARAGRVWPAELPFYGTAWRGPLARPGQLRSGAGRSRLSTLLTVGRHEFLASVRIPRYARLPASYIVGLVHRFFLAGPERLRRRPAAGPPHGGREEPLAVVRRFHRAAGPVPVPARRQHHQYVGG